MNEVEKLKAMMEKMGRETEEHRRIREIAEKLLGVTERQSLREVMEAMSATIATLFVLKGVGTGTARVVMEITTEAVVDIVGGFEAESGRGGL